MNIEENIIEQINRYAEAAKNLPVESIIAVKVDSIGKSYIQLKGSSVPPYLKLSEGLAKRICDDDYDHYYVVLDGIRYLWCEKHDDHTL